MQRNPVVSNYDTQPTRAPTAVRIYLKYYMIRVRVRTYYTSYEQNVYCCCSRYLVSSTEYVLDISRLSVWRLREQQQSMGSPPPPRGCVRPTGSPRSACCSARGSCTPRPRHHPWLIRRPLAAAAVPATGVLLSNVDPLSCARPPARSPAFCNSRTRYVCVQHTGVRECFVNRQQCGCPWGNEAWATMLADQQQHSTHNTLLLHAGKGQARFCLIWLILCPKVRTPAPPSGVVREPELDTFKGCIH